MKPPRLTKECPKVSGNRQQATGNRQQATGNRQQATGNHYIHLLNNRVNCLIVKYFPHNIIFSQLRNIGTAAYTPPKKHFGCCYGWKKY